MRMGVCYLYWEFVYLRGFSTVTERFYTKGASFTYAGFFFTPWAFNLLPGIPTRGPCFNLWLGCCIHGLGCGIGSFPFVFQ